MRMGRAAFGPAVLACALGLAVAAAAQTVSVQLTTAIPLYIPPEFAGARPSAVDPTPDGGFIITGASRPAERPLPIDRLLGWAVKVDSSGKIIWRYTQTSESAPGPHGDDSQVEGAGAAPLPDGSALVCMKGWFGLDIVHVSGNGDVIGRNHVTFAPDTTEVAATSVSCGPWRGGIGTVAAIRATDGNGKASSFFRVIRVNPSAIEINTTTLVDAEAPLVPLAPRFDLLSDDAIAVLFQENSGKRQTILGRADSSEKMATLVLSDAGASGSMEFVTDGRPQAWLRIFSDEPTPHLTSYDAQLMMAVSAPVTTELDGVRFETQQAFPMPDQKLFLRGFQRAQPQDKPGLLLAWSGLPPPLAFVPLARDEFSYGETLSAAGLSQDRHTLLIVSAAPGRRWPGAPSGGLTAYFVHLP